MLRFVFYAVLAVFGLALLCAGGVAWWALPQLPSTDRLREVRFQTPLKVFSADGSLIAEFGEKRRTPVAIAAVPTQLKQAFIAAEDDRFYSHLGVDWMAIARATLSLARSHEKNQGGSTITMQVARNFFLSREKTYTRKLKEIVLAMKIERELTKDEILELYLNKIFLGQRAYGAAAAAQVYFGSTLADLSLAECATIAGLPKAPSRVNPVTNHAAALDRRHYVLRRMLALRMIDQAAFSRADGAPLTAKLHGQPVETSAPHLAEMVRSFMQNKYGDDAYTQGFRVFTTLDSGKQYAASAALREALVTYDRRHGYRGPEKNFDLKTLPSTRWVEFFNSFEIVGGLEPALVTKVSGREVSALSMQGTTLTLGWEGLSWARRYLSEDRLGNAPSQALDLLKPGDIIRVQWLPTGAPGAKPTAASNAGGYWRLAQIPAVEGALVSVDSADGAVLALVGGFDFVTSKFNRVTQALRQPGSNFKPFIYSAALDHGFTPATFVNDAPIVFETPGLEGAWRPENYSGTYHGPTRLRDALANSRNLVSIRVMRDVGIERVMRHVSKFGFSAKTLPHNLSLALGTGEITPLQLVSGYAAFSNGGFRVDSYFIQRIEDSNGKQMFAADPAVACPACDSASANPEREPEDLAALIDTVKAQAKKVAPRAVDAQNAWMMYSMLKEVIASGTGKRALELNRTDLAGKTGTTNDLKDAWFSGFNGRMATTAWVGFDDSKTLGPEETGARVALPMWMAYMRTALKDTPMSEAPRPIGLMTVRIDPASGAAAGSGSSRAIYESFRPQDVPNSAGQQSTRSANPQPAASAIDQLF